MPVVHVDYFELCGLINKMALEMMMIWMTMYNNNEN